MFVVTAVHTKRRPICVNTSSPATKEQCVEKLRLPLAVSHSGRHVHPTKASSSARRVSKPRMTRNDSDRDAWNRNEKGRRPPMKFALGRPAPPRVRRFIPKPLILVERMRARQLVLEASPPVNHSMTAITTPPSTHVTPTPQRILTCSVLSSDSHSSSSVSFRVSSRKGVVFESGFKVLPLSTRSLFLGVSSSSTDTFVADSPCCVKQASKVPVLVMEIDAANVCASVEPRPEKKSLSDTGVSNLNDSVPEDVIHQSVRSTDIFEPTMTSTPFASSQANTNNVPSPDSFEIVSPTSRAVYPFNAPKGAYIVRLPYSASTTSLSNETRLASMPDTVTPFSKVTNPCASLTTFVNASGPNPSLELRRLSSPISSPSPTLVLDGVFALPSSPHLPRKTLHRFPQPRKPSARRPPPPSLPSPPPPPSPPLPPPPTPCDTQAPETNAFPVAPRSTPPRSPSAGSCGQPRSGPESPRSKLAHVLTAHVQPQIPSMSMSMSVSVSVLGSMMRVPRHDQGQGQGRGRTLVPPLIRDIQVPNDARTQCEIEGWRMRRVVGVQASRSSDDGGSENENESAGDDGKGQIERIGMVAKLRARWERGEGACGASQ